MIYNEDTYYVGYHRNVRELGALPAVTFDTICGLLRSDGIGEIGNGMLCEYLGISKQGLIKVVNKLIEAGYIEIVRGQGRGNTSTYMLTQKGKQSCRFFTDKRSTKLPEKVNKVTEKGQQSLPIIESINKKEKEGVPPTPDVMEKDFLEFWDLIKASPEFDYDKQHCSDVWDRIDPDWRAKLLQQVRMGLRWRNKPNDKPYYYLLDYRGQDVQVELPIMRQGTTKCAKWLQAAQQNGEKVCLMFEGEGDQQHVVYCLAKDRTICEAAGLRFCRDM